MQSYNFYCYIIYVIAALTLLNLAGIGLLGYYMAKGRDGPKLKFLAQVLRLASDIMFTIQFMSIIGERLMSSYLLAGGHGLSSVISTHNF